MKKIKEIFKHHNQKISILLFVLTLIIPIISVGFLIVYANFQNEVGKGIAYNYYFYSKIVLVFLPIPIMSFIMGLINKKKNIKGSTKNIISGAIVLMMLLKIGALSIGTEEHIGNYNDVLSYQYLLGIKFPSNGYVIKREHKDFLITKITNEKIMDIYYQNVAVDNLENDILSNPKWIKSLDYDYDNMDILNYNYYKMNNVYLLIFNRTTNEYNSQPQNSGTYEVLLAAYKQYSKHLIIHEYTYLYK